MPPSVLVYHRQFSSSEFFLTTESGQAAESTGSYQEVSFLSPLTAKQLSVHIMFQLSFQSFEIIWFIRNVFFFDTELFNDN